MPNLGEKTRIIQDYGLRIGKVDLISNTYIAIGEIAAVFGETSTVWDQDDVDEFDRIATLQNTTGNAQQFDFYVSGNAAQIKATSTSHQRRMQNWLYFWKSTHPSDDRYKTDLYGKARDNMRNIRVANDTKTLSYNSPRFKQDRRTISEMDSARAKRTWTQF